MKMLQKDRMAWVGGGCYACAFQGLGIAVATLVIQSKSRQLSLADNKLGGSQS